MIAEAAAAGNDILSHRAPDGKENFSPAWNLVIPFFFPIGLGKNV
jgi:hypothetical protein